uniref:Proton-coupled zinc antiporter SLC30A8 n=2 Tax=Cyprinus carpio TaxID=7962 RepID=A0A8C1E221_CYPCA
MFLSILSSGGDESCQKQLGRVLSIWQERAVYENDILDKLSDVLQVEKKAKKRPYEEIKVNNDDFTSQSSPTEPPQTADLIRALQELENAASSDAALRQRISSLPPEVQDTSLLHKVTDKESGGRLSRLVEEACMLLADYSGRLAAEIDDRRQLTRTLAVFLQSQKDGLAQNEYGRSCGLVSAVAMSAWPPLAIFTAPLIELDSHPITTLLVLWLSLLSFIMSPDGVILKNSIVMICRRKTHHSLIRNCLHTVRSHKATKTALLHSASSINTLPPGDAASTDKTNLTPVFNIIVILAFSIDEMKDGKHCHDNNNALEDREREKKLAKKRLYVVSAVCLVFIVGEIIGGYFAGSLAVMTDAAHLLVDLTSFIISLCSLWLSSRPATCTLSYGWHRAEILGALLSVFTIWLVTGVLVYLAVERLIHNDFTIDGTIMLITSGCAVLANIIMAFTLHQSGHGHSHGGLSGGHSHDHGKEKGHSHDHGKEKDHSHDHGKENGHRDSNANHCDTEENGSGKRQQANASVRAAFVHVIGDLLQSVSVLVSALIIFFKVKDQRLLASPEYKIADPICTFLFSIFVLLTTFTILRDIVIVLMEGTPAGVNYNEMRERLLGIKGVKAVHNLHIWALTMNQALLSVHVAIEDTVEPRVVLREITKACFTTYSFHSVTIQLEHQADQRADCSLCQNPTK